jgi:hypothetical protein
MRVAINEHARILFCRLQILFATPYQRESFKALLALFLKGDGRPHPHDSHSKSSSSLSRFLNRYRWNARSIIRQTRQAAITSLLVHYRIQRGRRPRLLVMLDLTCLEKMGRYEKLDLVRILNKKCEVQLVVLYLVAGPFNDAV